MQQRPAALIEVLNLRSTATTSSEYDCDQEMCCKQDKVCVGGGGSFLNLKLDVFSPQFIAEPLKLLYF